MTVHEMDEALAGLIGDHYRAVEKDLASLRHQRDYLDEQIAGCCEELRDQPRWDAIGDMTLDQLRATCERLGLDVPADLYADPDPEPEPELDPDEGMVLCVQCGTPTCGHGRLGQLCPECVTEELDDD